MITPFDFYKETLNQSKIGLAISSLSLAFLGVLGFYATHLYGQIDTLQKRLSSLKSKAVHSQEAADFIRDRQEDFAAFEACRFAHPLDPKTLQASFQYPLEFGAISSLDGISENNKFIAQGISFSIPCLRDRDIFAFLEQLTSRGPGLFQIHDIKITRLIPLTIEILEKIANGNPQVLFNGQITATWIHQ